MAFGSFSDGDGDGDGALAEINMIPLIDVMLVLLVIFIVTAPLLTHAVKVDLPKASSTPNSPPPESVQLSIDAATQMYWNGARVDAAELERQLKQAAARTPPPELHLRAERTTPYETLAQVMAAAARSGVTRIGFVTEPSAP
ncbi:MAG TPA: biopolymer transporter ExbD [Rhodocyclaceae bacterium]|nr:biopolymer transporter ExbD [Rhodocyclaceae bacterium]